MTLDLASRQDILEIKALLQELRAEQTAKPVPADEPLMDVQAVATYTHFDRKTVEKWVKRGDYDQKGKLIYLRAYAYCGRLRFKRADVEAFGLGTGVLAPSILPGEPPVATKPAPKQPKKSKTPVASEKALRRVA